jgi:hypothetical protein
MIWRDVEPLVLTALQIAPGGLVLEPDVVRKGLMLRNASRVARQVLDGCWRSVRWRQRDSCTNRNPSPFTVPPWAIARAI